MQVTRRLRRLQISTNFATRPLIDLLSFDHANDKVLVVAHSETIPSIVTNLGSFEEVEIGISDYAKLFVLTASDSGEMLLTRLRTP